MMVSVELCVRYCLPAGSANFATLAIQILPVLVKGDLPGCSGHLGDPLQGGGGSQDPQKFSGKKQRKREQIERQRDKKCKKVRDREIKNARMA